MVFSTIHKGGWRYLNDKTLTQVCSALYPYTLVLKYRDRYVDEQMPYAVFSVDGCNNEFLISYGSSPLFNCTSNLKFSSAQYITCDHNSLMFMVCLLYRASVADELINYCADTYGTETSFVPMHYYEPMLHSASTDSRMNLKLYFFHILWLLKSLLIVH